MSSVSGHLTPQVKLLLRFWVEVRLRFWVVCLSSIVVQFGGGTLREEDVLLKQEVTHDVILFLHHFMSNLETHRLTLLDRKLEAEL